MPQVVLQDVSPEMEGVMGEENPQQVVLVPQWAVLQVHQQ